MPSSIRELASRYRVERVAFDVAAAAYNASEDDDAEPALLLALNEAFERCQASAAALAQLPPGSYDDRDDQRTVAFDAAVLAGRQ